MGNLQKSLADLTWIRPGIISYISFLDARLALGPNHDTPTASTTGILMLLAILQFLVKLAILTIFGTMVDGTSGSVVCYTTGRHDGGLIYRR